MLLYCSEVWIAFHVLLLPAAAVPPDISKRVTSSHYVPDWVSLSFEDLGHPGMFLCATTLSAILCPEIEPQSHLWPPPHQFQFPAVFTATWGS